MSINRTRPSRKAAGRLVPAGASLAAMSPAAAQAYPDRLICVVVPFAAGGASDVVARAIAPKLTDKLGQSVVVEIAPAPAAAWRHGRALAGGRLHPAAGLELGDRAISNVVACPPYAMRSAISRRLR